MLQTNQTSILYFMCLKLNFYQFQIEYMIQTAGTDNNHLNSKTRSKKYEKVNGCTNSMPLWQLFGLAVLVAIEILSFDLIRSMIQLNYLLLYVLFGINYLLLIFVTIDYLILMLGDPSDPRLADPSYKEADQKLIFCSHCEANVSEKSYHCKTCDRCVDEFDHHCVFLNNCIGKQNYSTFFRLLLTLICHMSLNMGIGFSMFVQLNDTFKWVALSYAILSFLVFLEITVLAFFHCYISFCLFKSTLQVLRGKDNKISGQSIQIPVQKQQQPHSKNGPNMEQKIQEPTQMVLQKGNNNF